MSSLNKTFFNEKHRELGATMVDFGGWDMPVQYPKGVIREHLTCRKHSGLFDVSHMGRFIISGTDALNFLQYVLTNNAGALEINESQYTIIQDEDGYARGPHVADMLENNNIIVNYQATPEEKGFTASGSLRMGVSEMTRYGLKEEDFKTIAQLIHDAVEKNTPVKDKVKTLRNTYKDLQFCFDNDQEMNSLMEKLHAMV